MPDIQINTPKFITFEETELGTLVAINVENQKLIKKYWKTKDKSKVASHVVKGYSFIHDEEQDSLKIDFSEEKEFEIKNLAKFK